MARIYVGTCSWSDHAPFYPEGLPANQQIAYYAQHFPIVEINSTFYRPMPARNYALWAERTPPGFLFDVKPHLQLTFHDRERPPDGTAHGAWSVAMEPLREAGKLGCLTFQFAPWVTDNDQNRAYLRRLRDWHPTDPISIEFRHRSWLEGEGVPGLLELLREQRLGLTVVDEPQVGSGSVPTLLSVTTPSLSVVRFHGRNARTWYKRGGAASERFDYLYSGAELREWVPGVVALAEGAETLHLLFNNNAQDYAVQNARQLRMLLRELGQHEVVEPVG